MPRPPAGRRLPAVFWCIWTALLITKAGGFVVITLSLYLTTQRGLSTSMAGLVVAAFGIGGACGVLLGGELTDRLGRKPTMLIATFTSATVLAVLGEVGNVFAIAALVAVFGFSNAMLSPAAIAAIADVVHPDDRDRAFNLMFWALNIGMGSATLLAGFLAQYSYLLLFRLDAAAALATALLITFAVPETLPKQSTAGGPPVSKGKFTDVWRDRVYLAFVGLVFLQGYMFAQTQTTLPLAMTADGLSESDYGIVLSVGFGIIIIGQLLIPRLISRFGKAGVLAAALGFMAVGFGSLGLASSFAGYLGCALIWTAGNMLAAPPNATVIAELSPPRMRGRYQGVFSLTHTASAFAAPAIGGFTLQYLGDWHWAVVFVVGTLAAAGHWFSGPRRERAARDRAAVNSVPAAQPPAPAGSVPAHGE